jgi:hypothetical protein
MSAQFERQARANERDRKRAIRGKIKELRSRLRHAKRWRAQRLRDVRRVCRAALRLARQRAKEIRASERARAKLATQHRIAELYQTERSACEARKVQARHKAAEGAARASALLAAELEDVRRERIYADPNPLRRKGSKPRRATAAELRAESDDEVRGNIPAELVPVWERKKAKIKPTAHATRTEVFLEWAAEHGPEVRAIVDAEIEASVAELVREEAAQRRALGEGGPRAKAPRKPSRSKRAYRAALIAALGIRPEQRGDRYRLTTDELLDSLRRNDPARAHELQRAWPEWAPEVHDPAAPGPRVPTPQIGSAAFAKQSAARARGMAPPSSSRRTLAQAIAELTPELGSRDLSAVLTAIDAYDPERLALLLDTFEARGVSLSTPSRHVMLAAAARGSSSSAAMAPF